MQEENLDFAGNSQSICTARGFVLTLVQEYAAPLLPEIVAER